MLKRAATLKEGCLHEVFDHPGGGETTIQGKVDMRRWLHTYTPGGATKVAAARKAMYDHLASMGLTGKKALIDGRKVEDVIK